MIALHRGPKTSVKVSKAGLGTAATELYREVYFKMDHAGKDLNKTDDFSK